MDVAKRKKNDTILLKSSLAVNAGEDQHLITAELLRRTPVYIGGNLINIQLPPAYAGGNYLRRMPAVNT